MALDLSVYGIVDRTAAPMPVDELWPALARAGLGLVQYRDKHASTGKMVQAAGRMVAAAKAAGIPVLINDRIDVALATGAAGVHVGQEDMPVATARELLPDGAVIGLTVRSLAEAEAAPVELLNYISIGGVFPTQTKNNPTPPLGLDGLAAVVRRLQGRRADLPLCAIAGIDHHAVGGVMSAGVDGVAVVRAVFASPDPVQAVRALRIAVNASTKFS